VSIINVLKYKYLKSKLSGQNFSVMGKISHDMSKIFLYRWEREKWREIKREGKIKSFQITLNGSKCPALNSITIY
jgi:hypothetical protein